MSALKDKSQFTVERSGVRHCDFEECCLALAVPANYLGHDTRAMSTALMCNDNVALVKVYLLFTTRPSLRTVSLWLFQITPAQHYREANAICHFSLNPNDLCIHVDAQATGLVASFEGDRVLEVTTR